MKRTHRASVSFSDRSTPVPSSVADNGFTRDESTSSPLSTSHIAALSPMVSLKGTFSQDGLTHGLEVLVDTVQRHRSRNPRVTFFRLHICDPIISRAYLWRWGSPPFWRLVIGLYSISLLHLIYLRFLSDFTDVYYPPWILSVAHVPIILICHLLLLFPTLRKAMGPIVLSVSCIAYLMTTLTNIVLAGAGYLPLMSVPLHIIDLMFYSLTMAVPFAPLFIANILMLLLISVVHSITATHGSNWPTLVSFFSTGAVLTMFQAMALAVTYSVERRKKLSFINESLAADLGDITSNILRSLVPFHSTTQIIEGKTSEHHEDAAVGVIRLHVDQTSKAHMLVSFLQAAFVALDELALEMEVEKVNTFGTTYMVAAVGADALFKVSSFIMVSAQLLTDTSDASWSASAASGHMQLGAVGHTAMHVEVLGPAVSIAMILLSHAKPGTLATAGELCSALCSATPMGKIEGHSQHRDVEWVERLPLPVVRHRLAEVVSRNAKLGRVVEEIASNRPLAVEDTVAVLEARTPPTDLHSVASELTRDTDTPVTGALMLPIPRPENVAVSFDGLGQDHSSSAAATTVTASASLPLSAIRLAVDDSTDPEIASETETRLTMGSETAANDVLGFSLSNLTPFSHLGEIPAGRRRLTAERVEVEAGTIDSDMASESPVSVDFSPTESSGSESDNEDTCDMPRNGLNTVRFNIASSLHLDMTELVDSETISRHSNPSTFSPRAPDGDDMPRRRSQSVKILSTDSALPDLTKAGSLDPSTRLVTIAPPFDRRLHQSSSLTSTLSTTVSDSTGLTTQDTSESIAPLPRPHPLPPMMSTTALGMQNLNLIGLTSSESIQRAESQILSYSTSSTAVDQPLTARIGVVANLAYTGKGRDFDHAQMPLNQGMSSAAIVSAVTSTEELTGATSMARVSGLTTSAFDHRIVLSTRTLSSDARLFRSTPRVVLRHAIGWLLHGLPLTRPAQDYERYWNKSADSSRHTIVGACGFSFILLAVHSIIALCIPLLQFAELEDSRPHAFVPTVPYLLQLAGGSVIIAELAVKMAFHDLGSRLSGRSKHALSSLFILVNVSLLNLFMDTLYAQYFFTIRYLDDDVHLTPLCIYITAALLYLQYSSIMPIHGRSFLRLTLLVNAAAFIIILILLILFGLTPLANHWHMFPLIAFVPILSGLSRNTGDLGHAFRLLHLKRQTRINTIICAMLPSHLIDRVFLPETDSSSTPMRLHRHSTLSTLVAQPKSPLALAFDSVSSCSVTVIDFVNFSERIDTTKVGDRSFNFLNYVVDLADQRALEFGLAKIKTMGDRLMYVSGLFDGATNHALLSCRAAIAILRDIEAFNAIDPAVTLSARAGIGSGAACGSVFGSYRFSYDVLGPAVMRAVENETRCDPGSVFVSEETAVQLGSRFNLRKVGNGFTLSL
ncbi:Adenylate and Guanylate cyclase catalytic domain [Carpediemonas membranifera]|uniref:Adenylate and Guanylate cyclase catalytic domain n=1 Tax=Carpediemonas membranifera TaxID=201153 RepID=A0A8J6B633_9EUKA|nr:Adenylate and Guanylate cyclase catalytic domain [Carpediemonas membranifera]|eukprot:KAG9393617.1 Adenylate and Guanylate cyclase catalytic domain [Carpediemonas membranifera]